MPAHLADWLLTREQFEPVPTNPGLYRLTNPDHDGERRTRQAVQDLRQHGYQVQADPAVLDPALTPVPRQPTMRGALLEHRSRVAQAATARSPQRGPTLTTTPGTRPAPPGPSYAPPVGPATTSGQGRGR
ncbi:hypothetical protein OG607_41185 [Streptomyces sp. NBC_01537]|uniref:hypothetical protein n=1 Tax=Streptomyces sp. NBC_01537 TaxID=2903896 RepID=UPI00386302BA